MAESVHNEVVRVSLDDQKFIAGMNNIGKKTKAMFRQINADFNTLSMSGKWTQAYSTKVDGLKTLLKEVSDEAKDLRTQLDKTPKGAEYDKLATQLSKVRMEEERYAGALQKAQLGLTRAKTGVMDLRNNTKLLERETQANVNVFEAQGKQYTANAVKVRGYSQQLQSLGAQYKAEKVYLNEIASSLGRSSNEYREQATVVKETEARIKELAAAQQVAYSSVGRVGTGFTQAADKIHNFGTSNVEAGRNMTNMGNNMMITSYGIGRAFVAAGKAAIDLEQIYRENTNLIVKNADAEKIGAQVALSHAKTDGQRSEAKKRLTAAEYEGTHAQEISNQMMKQGRALSLEYGVSQTKIGQGYQELVKGGFSARESLGSMTSILQTSRATGEDYNRVLDVTIETMSQYSNSFKKSMSNTQRAAYTNNVLAAAANATKTSYSSLGEAMTNVGPVMSELGFDMADTAGIIGVLSQNGKDGAQAGNELKRAWMQLTSGSKQTQSAIKELGLDIFDSSGKTRDMADIMEDLQGKMKGMGQGEKEIILKKLFGAYARTAGSIMIDNADSIREVTAATKEAGDGGTYVADLATKNMDTAKAQIDRFKAALTELGMSFAREMLPTIKDLIKSLTGVVEGFGKLSPGMKKFITYGLAATAAAGPLLSIFGTLRSVTGFAALGFEKVGLGVARVATAARTGGGGLKVYNDVLNGTTKGAMNGTNSVGFLFKGMNALGTGAKSAGTSVKAAGSEMNAMGQMTAGAGAKTSIFSKAAKGAAGAVGSLIGVPLTPWTLGVVAAVGVGIFAWSKWGSVMQKNAEQTSKWGTTVNSSQEKALNGLVDFSAQTNVLMNNASSGTLENTQKIKAYFDSMSDNIIKNSNKEIKAIDETKSHLGKGYDTSALDARKKYYEESVTLAQHAKDVVAEIEQGQSESRRKLTKEDNVMLINAQNDLIRAQIKGLDLSSKKQKQITDQFNESFKDKNLGALQAMNDTYAAATAKTKEYKKALDDVKSANKGASASVKKDNWAQFVKENVGSLKPVYDNYQAQLDKINKTMPDGREKTMALGQAQTELKDNLEQLGIPYETFMKIMGESDKKLDTSAKGIVSTSGKMKDSVKDAANTWNDLVFDPKTGKMDADADKLIQNSKKGSKEWDSINLLIKTGKMDVTGMKEVSQATIAGNGWNKLTLKNQIAVAKVTGNDKVIDSLNTLDAWNYLTPEQKTAVATTKGKDDVFEAIGGIKAWNDATPAQKEAYVKTFGKENVEATVLTMENWNAMSPVDKKYTVQTLGQKDVVAMITDTKNWNAMTVDQKQASIDSLGHPELLNLIGGINAFDGLTPKQQQAVATAIGNGDVVSLMNTMGMWSGLSPKEKKAIAKQEGSDKVWAAIKTFGGWNKLSPKQKKAISKQTGKGDVDGAIRTIKSWSRTGTGSTKTAKSRQTGKGSVDAARGSFNSFSRLRNSITKTVKLVTQKITEIFTKKHKASGASSFEGGDVWLGDGGKREPYLSPSGDFGISGSDWEEHALEPGTKIWPSISAFNNTSGLKISAQNALKFASGGTVPDTIPNTSVVKGIQTVTNGTSATNNNGIDLSAVNNLTSRVDKLASELSSLSTSIDNNNSKEVVIYQDNRETARGIAPYVNKEIEKIQTRTNRLGGFK